MACLWCSSCRQLSAADTHKVQGACRPVGPIWPASRHPCSASSAAPLSQRSPAICSTDLTCCCASLTANSLAGGLPSAWVGKFKALRVLDVSNNALNSTLPDAWSAGLGGNLTELALGANNLTVRAALQLALAVYRSMLSSAGRAGLVAAKLG